jgi:hypothetical protein
MPAPAARALPPIASSSPGASEALGFAGKMRWGWLMGLKSLISLVWRKPGDRGESWNQWISEGFDVSDPSFRALFLFRGLFRRPSPALVGPFPRMAPAASGRRARFQRFAMLTPRPYSAQRPVWGLVSEQ